MTELDRPWKVIRSWVEDVDDGSRTPHPTKMARVATWPTKQAASDGAARLATTQGLPPSARDVVVTVERHVDGRWVPWPPPPATVNRDLGRARVAAARAALNRTQEAPA